MLRHVFLALSRSRRLKDFASGSALAWRGAGRFIAGHTIHDALNVVAGLADEGMTATLDHLGENVATVAEAEKARDAYLEAIAEIEGRGARTGISLKLTALGLDLGDAVAEANLRTILQAARAAARPVFVRIDMEGSPYTQRTLDMFSRLHSAFANLGVVIQSYLYRSDQDVEDLIRAGAHVRLVKGAYLEPASIAYPDKTDVDTAFLRQAGRLVSREARDRGVYAALATHDAAILDWAKGHAAEEDLAADEFELQMLYGVRRDLQSRLVAEGYRVRVYVPYGREWYPYYMRRLAERPENLAFVVRSLISERGRFTSR